MYPVKEISNEIGVKTKLTLVNLNYLTQQIKQDL